MGANSSIDKEGNKRFQLVDESGEQTVCFQGDEGALTFDPAVAQSMWVQRLQELEEEVADAQQSIKAKEEELASTQTLLAKLEHTVEQQAKDSEHELNRLKTLETTLVQQQSSTEERVSKLLLAVAGQKRRAELAELSVAEKDVQLTALQQMLAEERAKKSEAEDGKVQQVIQELQQQLAVEMAKSTELQNRILDKENRVREAQLNIIEVRDKEAAHAELAAQLQQQLASKERDRRELEEKLLDELNKRAATQIQIAEKDRQLHEGQKAADGNMLSCQQAAQDQLIEKEREVCELQNQLSSELSARQAVQYQMIEKERTICQLQQQFMACKVPYSNGMSEHRTLGLPPIVSAEVLDPETNSADETDEEEVHAGERASALVRPLAPGMVASVGLVHSVIVGNSNPSAQTFGGQFSHTGSTMVGTAFSARSPHPACTYRARSTVAVAPLTASMEARHGQRILMGAHTFN